MAYKSSAAGLILIVVTVFWAGATAQSSSCTNVLISMSPCLNYITGNSSNPSSQCCQQLASVVRSSPQCLCEVLNGSGSSLGININQTQALALPGACNVRTPPISRCNGTGSKTIPSTEGEPTSDGSSIKLSFSLLVFLLFAASYSSIFTLY
ncbi:AAI domain-containing protein [Citrus sinensis]|uniref:AAI domain-containing protein n=1 Tax=Citrus sinensis TaxID=2711 RepID=A0ACB8I630_CITSI|nr:AAI domain-containing protein [Citrus sinensis]